MALKPIDEELQKQIVATAHESALKKVGELNLPSVIDLSGDVPLLGPKTKARVLKMKDDAHDRFGIHAQSFFAFALKAYWYACWDVAYYFVESIKAGDMLDNDFTRMLSTAEGQAEYEGAAYTLYNKTAELSFENLTRGLAPDDLPSSLMTDQNVLFAIAYYWFHEANCEMDRGNVSAAMDFLYEAFDALHLEQGIFMWNEGEKFAREEISSIEDGTKGSSSFTAAAAQLAKRRHAENYALIEDAKKYWRENIDPSISAAKAANELVRIVPLSHKKLSEVIAAEKKKLP